MGTSTDVTVSRSVARSMHSRGTDGVSRPGSDDTTVGMAFTDVDGLESLLGPVQAVSCVGLFEDALQPVFSVGLVEIAAPWLLINECELCSDPDLSDALCATRTRATSVGMPSDTTGVRSSCSESTMCAG